ncbi:HPF/RaiA family ribosome-associated protein [Solimonas soli]|uniref:HPF/RaiA family ribosome-associated protein n=1 Tax=Solimonas soli TaxID=413479 RepID=UPI000480B132|nr:HPF/RaiA family ribosome-associated protein [Solimonas soli]
MSIPLSIEFRHLERSAALEQLAREHFAAIAERYGDVLRGRVVIDIPQHRQHAGKPLTVGIHIARRGGGLDALHEGTQGAAYATVRDAFDALRRQLDDDTRIRRGDVKHHAEDAL